MPEAVGENPRIVGELLDGRQVAFQRGVAQPHRGVGIDRADREVFRHPLHEPQRWIHVDERLDPGTDAAPAEHVVLELVHHLVADHVLELGVGAGEGQDHAVLEKLGDAARALTDVAADRVGLLEVRLRGVQDDRLAALKLVVQDAGEARVPPLRHACCVERRRALGRIVIDLEVIGLDDLEVEGPVLDLVLPEVLRRQRRRARERQRRHCCCDPSHGDRPFYPSSRVPPASTGASPHSRSSW